MLPKKGFVKYSNWKRFYFFNMPKFVNAIY